MSSEWPSWRSILIAALICALTWPLAALLLQPQNSLLTAIAFLPFIIGLFAFMIAAGGLWRRFFPRSVSSARAQKAPAAPSDDTENKN